MNTSHTTTDMPIDVDLQALADEIAATTGLSPATALDLARRQRPALQQFVQRWDAEAETARQLTLRSQPATRPPQES